MKLKKESKELVADIVGIIASITLSLVVINIIIMWSEPFYMPLYKGGGHEALIRLGTMIFISTIIIPAVITFFVFKLLKAKKFIVNNKKHIKKSLLNVVVALGITQVFLSIMSVVISDIWCKATMIDNGCIPHDLFISYFSIWTQWTQYDSILSFLPIVGLLIGIFMGYHYNGHKILSKRK